jgi:hypothetical protein
VGRGIRAVNRRGRSGVGSIEGARLRFDVRAPAPPSSAVVASFADLEPPAMGSAVECCHDRDKHFG